uniref:Tetratricopeptide repeat protein 39B n=1 Tax=Periophthalmus magnuspinnatus TaxID=409849 RepID=A0A3B3ZUY1_9GOBI
MHAELCYAEVLLQKAALTFLDESIIGFIKGGMRIRNSYQIYKKEEQLGSLVHFKSGVSMGIGSFNLVRALTHTISLLNFFQYAQSSHAQEKFLACIAAQEEWRQIHHLCYWELMWAYCFEQNWSEAYRYANLLCKESKWSQAVYMFLKAAILSMLPEEEVTKMGENVSCQTSPQEMIYVWNGFTVVGKRPELTEGFLSSLKTAEQKLNDSKNPSVYHLDDQCVVQLLKGLCLRELGQLDQAELSFNHVISRETEIKFNNYLVPYTMYELGLLHKQRGDFDKAIEIMENVK